MIEVTYPYWVLRCKILGRASYYRDESERTPYPSRATRFSHNPGVSRLGKRVMYPVLRLRANEVYDANVTA